MTIERELLASFNLTFLKGRTDEIGERPLSTQFQPFPAALRAPETGRAALEGFLPKAAFQQTTPSQSFPFVAINVRSRQELPAGTSKWRGRKAPSSRSLGASRWHLPEAAIEGGQGG